MMGVPQTAAASSSASPSVLVPSNDEELGSLLHAAETAANQVRNAIRRNP
jgi:hypothetical protein